MMSDVRNKPCMSHYPDFDHHCASKGQGCEYYESEEYNNIEVFSLTFYKADDDGNELLNDDGSVKIFLANNYDYSYLADGLEESLLTEKSDE